VTWRCIALIESAVRVCVAVLVGFLAFKVVTQDSDAGVPTFLVVPVAAYAAWNVGIALWLVLRAAKLLNREASMRAARAVALMATVRLVWLLPLARDPWWRSPQLTALVVATVAVIATSVLRYYRPLIGRVERS
jgi:hypothetical protein